MIKHTEATKIKISDSLKGRKRPVSDFSDEWRKKQSLSQKIRIKRDGHHNLGKKWKMNPKKTKNMARGEGCKNPAWKGGDVSHYWAKHAPRPKPEQCEVCGAFGNDTKKGIVYDHNHNTGKFRGWICLRCNVALGMVKDNIEILQNLIKYLEDNN